MALDEPQARPLRVDAERNRQRILAAAAELYAERGLDVSIDDIAAAAGVGVGTVYRRFPDREALVSALFQAKVARIAALAEDALTEEDPWVGFEGFMRAAVRLQAQDRGLHQVLVSADRGCERLAGMRNEIRPIVERVIGRAKAAGVLREDLHVLDVPMLHAALSGIADLTRDVAPEYYERLLTVVLDGLRAERTGTAPMPGPPIADDAFTTAMMSRRRCR